MDIQAIQDFQNSYRAARDSNSREIRLTVNQAQKLNDSIGAVLAQLVKQQNQTITLQEQLTNALKNPTMDWNGGRF
tara:strand:+ start:379 stop:606 length:228 start_codon:yes stop_codon:yes gene_type:complete